MKKLLLLLLLQLLLFKADAQSYVFAQLTGAPVNTTGWNLTGNAYVGNTPVGAGNSEIILTDPFNSQSGAIFFTSPIDIVQCNKWTVDFEFRMFDGSAADGIAFCLLDVPPSGFVGGGGVGIPAASNGLKIVFDSFDNCGAPNPAIQIRYGAGYAGGECNGAQPTIDNNSGNLSFLRSNGYNTARVEYDAGNIEVYVNGTQYLSGFYSINFTTYAGFTASTGGANDRHSIRNVVIRTDRAQPTAYSGPSATTCSNQPIQIGSTPNANYQYQWIPATGLDNATIGNPTLTLTNNGTTPQTYVYKVGANIIGTTCVAYDSVTVTVNPLPTATFSATSPVCQNQPADITYQGSGTAAGTYNWVWDTGIATPLGNENYTVSWGNAGVKTITLTVIENGCQGTPFSQNITVNPTPIIDFSITPTVCQGQDAQASYNGVPSPTASFNWFWNGGNASLISGQDYNVNWDVAGTYPITLIMTDNGCQSAPAIHAVSVEFQPIADFSFLPVACINKPLDITFSGTSPITSQYTWVLGNGGVLGGAGTEINGTWPAAGNPDVTLTVTEGNCSSTITKQVNIIPPPKPNLATSYNICLGDELNLDPGNYVSYLWEDGDDDRIHNVSLTGLYTVTVVDANGCEGTGQTLVTDTTCLTLYIPNAFTPNGDNNNDLFMPVAEFSIDYRLWIYNRWGELMFSSSNPNMPWDGEINGIQCLPDVYVYKLEFSGYESDRIIKGSRKGTIALIR